MYSYEYKCVFIWGLSLRITKILNDFGAQGWELVEI